MDTQDAALADVLLSEEELRQAEEFRRSKNTSVLVIVFADMEGSAALHESLGQVQFQRVRDQMMQVLVDAVTEKGEGIVLKNTGDGVLAIFAEPSTAVERALAIQSELHGDPYIKVRIGMDIDGVRIDQIANLRALRAGQ